MATPIGVSRALLSSSRTMTMQASWMAAAKPALACAFSRPYSSSVDDDAPPPPLLSKLKGDLKTAMRAKDKARLSVLRSVLSATLNASKTANPIKTDVQLVALLRRNARTQKDAADEFRSAGRSDLAESEEAQIAVLEEYAAGSGVETLGPEEIQATAEAVLAEAKEEGGGKVAGKSVASELMKRLLGPQGRLAGKDVDKAQVAVIVKKLAAKEA